MSTKIAEGIQVTYQRIDAACEACGRDPKEVTLCLATKTRAMSEVLEAVEHCREDHPVIAENIVQTAMERVAEGIHDHSKVEKHFIGHLQTNKVNNILSFADCIQTVDSGKLAAKIYSRLTTINKTIHIYLQVNTSGEDQKSGCTPEECIPLAKNISEKFGDKIHISGLMTVGINSPDRDLVRKCFRTLKSLQSEINELQLSNILINNLSMGMSGDLEEAIAEGSTMVRVGTAIFGERDYGAKKEATSTSET